MKPHISIGYLYKYEQNNLEWEVKQQKNLTIKYNFF